MSQPSALIFNIMRYAVHDGPGIRTTVFFKGCPLDCWWCHNPEGQGYRPEVMYAQDRCRMCGDCAEACPQLAIHLEDGRMETSPSLCRLCGQCLDFCVAGARSIVGRRIALPELLAEIEKDIVFFDQSGGGVTLSGGEPLSQPRFVETLLDECRRRRIHTVIETCGLAPQETFTRIAALADLVLFDLKLLDPEKHRRYTGVWPDRIIANLEALAATGRPPVVRIPVVPGINDSDAEMRRFRMLAVRTGVRRVDLLPYHRIAADKYRRLGPAYRLNGTPEPARHALERMADEFVEAGLEVRIGG